MSDWKRIRFAAHTANEHVLIRVHRHGLHNALYSIKRLIALFRMRPI
jgi:hypothetical protein